MDLESKIKKIKYVQDQVHPDLMASCRASCKGQRSSLTKAVARTVIVFLPASLPMDLEKRHDMDERKGSRHDARQQGRGE
jgi:hypothetical protein